MTPTFLVYTMHCGEPDFPYCQAAIAAQKGVIVKHVVVNNLPEREAHNVVYQAFNKADPAWIRVKLDADVVLSDDGVFERVAKDLATWSLSAGLKPTVRDHLTETEINAGVMFYTSRIIFLEQVNPLKCDRNVIMDEDNMKISDWHCVGDHMKHCNELTAFRFGLHRGLKGQVPIMNAVRKAYLRHQDPVRLMAIRGFETAFLDPRFRTWSSTGREVPDKHNYGDVELMELYEAARKR